jgi:extracellular matrix protein 14
MVATRFLLLSIPLAAAVPSATFVHSTQYSAATQETVWYRSHPSLSTIKQRIVHYWPFNTSLKQQEAGRVTSLSRNDNLVLRFNVSSPSHITALLEASNTLFLDIWDQSEQWVDIRLRYDDVSSLLGLLPKSLQHSHTALLTGDELARAIQRTYPSTSSTPFEYTHRQRATSRTEQLLRRPNSDVFFDDYRSLPVIIPWMRLLQSLFASHVQILSIGKSYEGRDIPALRVGVHPTNSAASSPSRKTILVTGGIHAREWVSTSTVNYVAYNLITQYGRRKAITNLLEQFDFVFIPTLNPDGYEYTWNTDRLWRKNRQPTPLRFCHGLDLDRTYSYKWDGNTSSSSENPCSEAYAGSEPFEATESHALADWARNETEHNNVNFVGLLDLHSYSQQILYPFSYSCDAHPRNYEDLAEMASGLAKAIRTKAHENYRVLSACGTDVSLGSAITGVNAAGGSLLDWAYQELYVHYAFQIKLRDKGSYGFLLPRDEIVPTGAEMMKAVEYFGRQLGAKYGTADFEDVWREEDEEEARRVEKTDESLFGNQKALV